MKHNMTPAQWHAHLIPVLQAVEANQPIEMAESMDSTDWQSCGGKNFNTHQVYRPKVTKRLCNGVELPACLTQFNTLIFYVAVPTNEHYCCEGHLDCMDASDALPLLERGLVYSTPEAAAIHGKAMCVTTGA